MSGRVPSGGVAILRDEINWPDEGKPAPPLRAQEQIGGEGCPGIGRIEIDLRIAQILYIGFKQHHRGQSRGLLALFDHLKNRIVGHTETDDRGNGFT